MSAALRDAHLVATSAIAGMVWFVQGVHYPLFRLTTRGYGEMHARRTGWVVAPLMLAELGLAIALAFFQPSPVTRAGLLLLLAIWLSTFLLQVPLHEQLRDTFDGAAHSQLVRTNWIRTVAWSARAILACLITS